MIHWDFRFCVFTARTPEGFVTLMPDFYGDAVGGGVPLESASPFGFLSRPRDPDTDAEGNPVAAGAAGLLLLEHGGHDYAIPTQDPRFAAKLPEVKKGGSMQYAITEAGEPSYALFDGEDGSWRLELPAGAEAVLGGEGAKHLINADLLDWIEQKLLPKLAAAPGGAIMVDPPPAAVKTQTTRAA